MIRLTPDQTNFRKHGTPMKDLTPDETLIYNKIVEVCDKQRHASSNEVWARLQYDHLIFDEETIKVIFDNLTFIGLIKNTGHRYNKVVVLSPEEIVRKRLKNEAWAREVLLQRSCP